MLTCNLLWGVSNDILCKGELPEGWQCCGQRRQGSSTQPIVTQLERVEGGEMAEDIRDMGK